MNVAIFWDIMLCSPYVNRRLGGTYYFHLQDRKSAEQETSVQQVTRRYISENGNILLEDQFGIITSKFPTGVSIPEGR
jgi:hypothetical protein